MLELQPKSFFSSAYTFRTPSYELVEIQASPWRARAQFTLQTVPYRIYRQKVWRGDFLLERVFGQVLGRAVKPSVFRNRYQIELDGRVYLMRRQGAFKRDFVVMADNEVIGSIRYANTLSRNILVDLPADWPLPRQVFLFWLALKAWRRNQAAAASGA